MNHSFVPLTTPYGDTQRCLTCGWIGDQAPARCYQGEMEADARRLFGGGSR